MTFYDLINKDSFVKKILLTSPKWLDKKLGFCCFGFAKPSNYTMVKGVIPMVCTSAKEGLECIFMTKKGCSFNGGTCHQIKEECNGCNRASEFSSGWYCTACPDPSTKWKNGSCNLATHVVKESKAKNTKINPLKASKRKGR